MNQVLHANQAAGADYSPLVLTDDEVRMVLAERERSPARATNPKTIVLLVDETTTQARLMNEQRQMLRMAPDTVKVFSIYPFDIRKAAFWAETEQAWAAVGFPVEAEMATQHRIDDFVAASGNVRVLVA